MKKFLAVLLVLCTVLLSVSAQGSAEKEPLIVSIVNVKGDGSEKIAEAVETPAVETVLEEIGAKAEGQVVEEVHTFSYDTLSASADKEQVTEGTPVDSEGLGYFTASGAVTKRWADGKGVTSVEVGKAASGSIDFTVRGEAEVQLVVSSNGKTNESPIAIVDADGNVVKNNEGLETVSTTSKTSLTYTLPAGSYRIVSPENPDLKRGARVFAISVVEKVMKIEEVKVTLVEESHSFSCDTLSASADKEAIAEKSAIDTENTGYFTTSGAVTKRWADGKGVTSVEVGKALSSSIDFMVSGDADVVLVVSSNGKSNESPIAILDNNGNVMKNNEGLEIVSTTSKTTLTYTLPAGSYKVASPENPDLKRGARIYSIDVIEKVEKVEKASKVHDWDFRFFGVSVGDNRNYVISRGDGIEKDVSLSSATFKEDGSINKKGGKFVADSPADGGSYYYTVIDPTTTNFYFQADVTVDQLNPSLDGQEGFALMARDSLGQQGVSGNWMANLVSVTATKLPSPETAATIGFRGYTGIRTPEASDANDIVSTRVGWYKDADGNQKKIEAGKTYRVSLEKTDYAYIASQYDIETGSLIGSYTYYIPAKDRDATSVKSYRELDDPLTYQEGNAAYIAMVVARGLNATFSNIEFTTSSWKASEWKPQPTTYVDLSTALLSSATSNEGSYNLIFRTNADGSAKVIVDGNTEVESVAVKAGIQTSVPLEMAAGEKDVKIEFTPDPDFRFSVFEKLASYDMVTFGQKVFIRSLGKDGIIYVSPAGSADNGGSSASDPVDLITALSYAAPGQCVLLESAVYDLSDRSIVISRGRDGSAEQPITVTTADGRFATLDFGRSGEGVKLWGDYWNISKVNITRTANGKHGMQLGGDYCTLERMNFFNNGTSGLTVSGDSKDPKEYWPAYNLVKNCTSINNADKALEDADGFCAKLTTGEGNVFDGCISAYNADDGWDLFAKVSSGTIGKVTIKNSLTYKNGYLMVKEGSSAKKFEYADITCDDNGTLSFVGGVEMEAGNGNGFKMGGSSLPGGHTLINSIAYENKTKGIDSNSCSDIKAYNCTSYNNGSYNIAMYTGNKGATTGFEASGIISFRSGEYRNLAETLSLQKQDNSVVYGPSNYYWDTEKKSSLNTMGTQVSEDWFISLDTSVAPERKEDGSIDMHGLLLLNEEARGEVGAGARGFAWGQKEATVWVVGDSTVSPFKDKYYIPREGYGEELSNYFNVTAYNLAHSGASSRDYTKMVDYDILMNGNASVPALGDAETENFLVIGFGHNDEKSEDARYSDPNGDYKSEGSFANSLYVNYIVPALERNVVPVLCTPIARLTSSNTLESYDSASGHRTQDVTIGERTFRGGDYAKAIIDMVADLRRDGIEVELVDLTKASIDLNVQLGEGAQYLHSFTGAKYASDGKTLVPTGLDQTHTNVYGARVNAWMISTLSKESAPRFYSYSLNKEMPTYEEFFQASVNPDYVVVDYRTPSEEKMASAPWPVYTDKSGIVWHGSVFGDVGGANKITDEFFQAAIAGDEVTLSVNKNAGKIASGSDGMIFYYTKLPVGTKFTLSAKARINSFAANNQVSFGLMVRDDLYIDEYVATTMGDYVAAGPRNQGKIVNFGRKSSALVGEPPVNAIDLNPGAEVDLKIVGTKEGFALTYGPETVSAGFDYALTGVDSDYIYAGFYAVRNCSVTFSDVSLVISND